MATRTYVLAARSAGTPQTGLTPTWVFFKKLSDGTNLSQPSITEVASGQYKFDYDPAVPASGQVDVGSAVPDAGDRYVDVACL